MCYQTFKLPKITEIISTFFWWYPKKSCFFDFSLKLQSAKFWPKLNFKQNAEIVISVSKVLKMTILLSLGHIGNMKNFCWHGPWRFSFWPPIRDTGENFVGNFFDDCRLIDRGLRRVDADAQNVGRDCVGVAIYTTSVNADRWAEGVHDTRVGANAEDIGLDSRGVGSYVRLVSADAKAVTNDRRLIDRGLRRVGGDRKHVCADCCRVCADAEIIVAYRGSVNIYLTCVCAYAKYVITDWRYVDILLVWDRGDSCNIRAYRYDVDRHLLAVNDCITCNEGRDECDNVDAWNSFLNLCRHERDGWCLARKVWWQGWNAHHISRNYHCVWRDSIWQCDHWCHVTGDFNSIGYYLIWQCR